MLGNLTRLPGAFRCLLTTSRHALGSGGQLGGCCGDLADLLLLVFDFGERPAGLGIQRQDRIADTYGFLIDTQQAGTQLHYRDVQRAADGSQLVTALHSHFHTQIAVTQGFSQRGDASGAVANRGLQTGEQIDRHDHQNTEDHRHRDELRVGSLMVVIEASIERVKRLPAQICRTASQRVDALFELFRFELDAAAENTFVNDLQLCFQHLHHCSVLFGPRLQLLGKLGQQQAGGLLHLILGVIDATTQVAHLQAALQAELPRCHRRLPHTRQTTDTLDQVRHLLGGKLHQHVGFKPGVENQTAVHRDLLTQRLDQIQHRGEAVVAIRPPAHRAQ
ncbi:hypothetical protein ALP85_200054 [Pseudomonas syringae pv. syringae]|nr:hypothetical protein ALP85_200054 [Pseudomonas syringae pv. syringae]